MKTKLLSVLFLGASLLTFTSCEDHRLSPNADFPERINFFAERQYPEGIAYSQKLDRFIITSLTQGKIGTVSIDGKYEDLVSDPALIAGVGVKVADNRIYVASSDNGVSSKSSPATIAQRAELLIFNIDTRSLERRVDLDDLLPGVRHFANDLALNPDGTVYITDSFAPVIYKVTSDGTPSILVRDDVLFSSPGFGLNGIVYHPDGFLVVANAGAGKLFKVDLKNGNAITEVGEINNLPGDGLTLVGNTDLYVVSRGNRVALVRSSNNFASASVVESRTDGYAQATTSTYVNGQVFTLNARIGEIGAAMGDRSKLQANDYSIQRYK